MREEALENVVYILITGTGTLLSGFTVLALLALAIASDSRWLSGLVFVLGWAISWVTGLFVWALLKRPVQGVGLTGEDIQFIFWGLPMVGYPVVALLIWYRFRTMPREKSITWKRALTSGALVGFGVGTGGKALQGGSGFGGFGGGSFGGGGASGSFQGAVSSGAASGTGGVSVGTAGAAVGTGATMRDLAEETASAATEKAPSSRPSDEGTADAAGEEEDSLSSGDGSWGLRHGCGFLLVALVFIGVGWGFAAALPVRVLQGLLVLGGAYLAFQLIWRAWSTTRDGRSGSAFKGGEASASWS